MNEDRAVERMREDWNRRALEDAHYYVAFGRREQNDDEFFETAEEVIAGLDWEMRRLGPGNRRARRALEIGCGPGRLLKPMSSRFGEIHGVDVSDEMIRMAREKLRGIPNAHVHATDGASLPQFADESFDMVYSYAVFQHIPSKDIVLEYLRESRRVLKPGGIFRAQFNGLPESLPQYDTWSGVRFRPGELTQFARDQDFQVLALEGAETQYMWTTWRKRGPGWRERAREQASRANVRVRTITNAQNAAPAVPAWGRFASITIWVTGLPDNADLYDLQVLLDGRPARQTYIGSPDDKGLQQLNAVVPAGMRTGLVPVEVRWFGRTITNPASVRVIPAGPQIPRVMALSDGVNLMAGTRIESGVVKATIEELLHPEQFSARIDDINVEGLEVLCTDPQPPRYEFNFRVPARVTVGPHTLYMRVGRRELMPAQIEIVR